MKRKEDDFVKLERNRLDYARRPKCRDKIWRESLVAAWLVRCVNEQDGFITKLHPITAKGIPDYLVIIHGKTLFVETKTTGETCTPAQIEFHRRLKSKGVETYVLDTKITNFYDLYNVAYKTYGQK